MPELKSPVMDSIYTEDKRRNHPLPTVSVSDLQQAVKNIAITKRGGGEPIPVYEDSFNITHIEPQPFRPSERLNGVDVNNLKLLDDTGVELLVNNKIDRLRRIVRASTEAMAAQSLKGSIAYPMAMDGALPHIVSISALHSLTLLIPHGQIRVSLSIPSSPTSSLWRRLFRQRPTMVLRSNSGQGRMLSCSCQGCSGYQQQFYIRYHRREDYQYRRFQRSAYEQLIHRPSHRLTGEGCGLR